jgi:hypothetical protein
MEAEGSLHVHKSPPPVPTLDEVWCTTRADATVTLFARIQNVLSSNNGRDASYPDWDVSWFSQSLHANYKTKPWQTLPNLFQFIYHPAIQLYIVTCPGFRNQ